MVFGNDPGLKRKPGCKGLEDDEFSGIHHNPFTKVEFFLNRITIDTPPVVIIISGCLLQFFPDIGWNDSGSNNLRMGVFE
jgi:hypothetical protein